MEVVQWVQSFRFARCESCGDLFQDNVNYLILLNCTLKIVTMVNFMLIKTSE
jgi:hypothetical protein